MIKICILGSSHVACLTHGWEIIKADYGQVVITFFANDGFGIADDLKVNGRWLVPGNEYLKKFMVFIPGGLEYVVMDLFDHCLIYGLGLRLYNFNWAYYSTQVIEQALRDHVYDGPAWRLLQNVRRITHKTI